MTSNSKIQSLFSSIRDDFNSGAVSPSPDIVNNGTVGSLKESSKGMRPTPFSLRLTREERAYLEDRAGSRPLGAYIRDQLLEDRHHKRRELRKPHIDDQKAAQILAALKHSHIASNLNQLARSVHCGNLLLDQVHQEELENACAAVIAMRNALFIALGVKVPDAIVED